jgi:hypothetical protein
MTNRTEDTMNPTFAQTFINHEFRGSAAFETSPALITAEIAAFACPAATTHPVRVAVQPREGALEGWCVRNVAAAVKAEGGHPVFGWLVWTAAHFMTAEYHSVWMTPAGTLLDPTPKVDGERYVVFGADPGAGPDYDFLARPPARRIRTYVGRTRLERARDAIACFNEKELRSKRSRAQKSEQSLDEWVAARLSEHDQLEIAIDRLLNCSNEIEELLTPTVDGMMCRDLDEYDRLNTEKLRHLRQLDAVVARRRALGILGIR